LYLMRVCASHNQDLPCIQGVHPHPTPPNRQVFPVRRKRTRSSYAVQMGQTSPKGHRCSRGTNNPVTAPAPRPQAAGPRAQAPDPGTPPPGPEHRSSRSIGSGSGGRAYGGRTPARRRPIREAHWCGRRTGAGGALVREARDTGGARYGRRTGAGQTPGRADADAGRAMRGAGAANPRTKQTHRWPLGICCPSSRANGAIEPVRPMAGYGYRGGSCFASGR
jgi:hypothetical protein